ncbi:GTP cyclohydrolase II [Dolosigranulum pigrum]|uniref:GTP cyclohydrolase II n=1 Tax=Dolosigranulum pigrum TaxID=29394 RepID=UPI001AD861BC|nr:GTP cyclohydrolase II [Dolosigranulum pigrum]QTJ49658.1 GTP cyclohydrolase II [Dolosigranulum pigrum]
MNKIVQAVNWLKKGGLVIIADDESRESEGDLVGLADFVTDESVNFMTKYGRGLICAPVSKQIAKRLELPHMTTNNSDPYGTAFTISVDHLQTSTGISASDRAITINKLADINSVKSDFHRPGHIFPLVAKEGGVLERRGHTEAAIDLAKLADVTEAAYICEILKEDGTMARLPDLKILAEKWDIPLITVEELANYLSHSSDNLTVDLPTKYGYFNLTLYEDEGDKDHLLISKGDIKNSTDPVLIRLHSECQTGDIFGSCRCDCGKQLEQSLKQIEVAGKGAVLYLRQEGRGIGLKNKLRAYQLQEQGVDTFDANILLGFKSDERDYYFAAKILNTLGISKIKLMTNNPDKVQAIENAGIHVVERIPLETKPVKENINYLKTKKTKFNHYLSV